MLVYFADVRARSLLIEARFGYTEVILFYILFLCIKPLANEFSNHFICVAMHLLNILSKPRRTKRKTSEAATWFSADVETTSGARLRDQDAPRAIDTIFPLVNRKIKRASVCGEGGR